MDASDAPGMNEAALAVYARYTKLELVTLCRQHGWTGDNARASKDELATFAAAHGVTADSPQQSAKPADLLAQAMAAMMATLPAAVDENRVRELCGEMIGNQQPSVSEEGLRAIVAEAIANAIAGIRPDRLEVTVNGGAAHTVNGRRHRLFDKLVKAATAKTLVTGQRVQLWLAGPTGSGKTHAAEQLAEALGLPFYFNGAIDTEYKLLGFVDAQGRIVSTAFREAFTNGGVYLFDEVDASLPAATLAFNAALSNGYADFPGGMVKRHPDFYAIAAANTYGHGATADYVGRFKMDAAFLNRFAKVFWDYDEEMERDLTGNDDWTDTVQAARRRARTVNGLKIIVSPRDSMVGAGLLAAGFEREEVIAMTFGAGLTPEQLRNLLGA